jgi:hypothetical protein
MKNRKDVFLGLEDIVRLLQQRVKQAGTQAEWARKNDVNPADLSSTITGKRPPTKDVLRALKLKKVFAYEHEVYQGSKAKGRNKRNGGLRPSGA